MLSDKNANKEARGTASAGTAWHRRAQLTKAELKNSKTQLTSDWGRLLQDAPSRLPLQNRGGKWMKHIDATLVHASKLNLET